MTESGFDHDERREPNLDALTAAQLLDDADRVGAKLQSRTDFRAHALIQGWTAAALFVYVATFLLLSNNPTYGGPTAGISHSYVNVLLIPFIVLSQLVQGARNRLPISLALPHRGTKLLIVLPGVIIFLAAGAANIIGMNNPWWANLLVSAAIAAPLGGLAISTAKKAVGTALVTEGASARPPLSRTAARMTAGLGVYFGIVAAVTPYFWFPLAALFLTLALLVLTFGWGVRWGLPSVGSEWGQPQWIAFGITFTLLFALKIMATKTAWNTPLVATITSIAIAAPLVCSTLRTYRQQ